MDRAKLAEKNKHLNDQIAAVPTIQDLGSVLEAISSELQDAGARDRQLTTGPESTYQQLAYVTVTLAFKGSQQSIITFLRALSNSSFPVRVSRLEIIRPDGATSHELTTDIVLYVFLRTSETPLQ